VCIILDECLPRRLGLLLLGHNVTTVARAGWAGVKNGQLLDLIEGAYDAFITIDKNLPNQQHTDGLSFGIIMLRALSNRLEALEPLVPKIIDVLGVLEPGQIVLLAAGTPVQKA
jgi:hypothetical protein